MNKEQEIITLILDKNLLGVQDLSAHLASIGYFNANGLPFSQAQMNSVLHSVRQEVRRRNYKYVESCGIDREKNPCGDASDY